MADVIEIESNSASILVVDDSLTARRHLRSVLQERGYDVFEAHDGKSGMLACGERSFDVVLVDLNMPVVDGMQMIRELRGLDGYENTPIFVVTSEVSTRIREVGREAGVNAWVVKPVNGEVRAR